MKNNLKMMNARANTPTFLRINPKSADSQPLEPRDDEFKTNNRLNYKFP